MFGLRWTNLIEKKAYLVRRSGGKGNKVSDVKVRGGLLVKSNKEHYIVKLIDIH